MFMHLELIIEQSLISCIDLTSEEEEQQAQVVSLLEAKRRGISHSALRSHQPVARPMSAGLSR